MGAIGASAGTTDPRLWVRGGIAGIAGTAAYVLAIAIPWPTSRLGTATSLLVVSAWPILSIVYSHALFDFIAAERDGAANRLALIFAIAGFATVLAMIVVQLAVGAGIDEATRGLDATVARALRRGIRMVDMGLDVAWDMLIGTALIFSGISMRHRRGLGVGWTVASVTLGSALVLLNAATFPWPPASRGLFDIGPLVGVFVVLLAGRLVVLGRRPAP